jgi:hypothetical protein
LTAGLGRAFTFELLAILRRWVGAP